jgi:O-methyltransferase
MNLYIVKIIKEVLFNTLFRKYFFPRFVYNFTAPQLCFLCNCIENTRYVEGAIAEIGCHSGDTTIFLNNYIFNQKINKIYYAIDTFSGFVEEDINYEVTIRGKPKKYFTGANVKGFGVNKKKWFDATISQHNITWVQSIEADINTYDMKSIGPLSFALLDIDLYRPMIKCLRELYGVLSPGGIIAVDDCFPAEHVFDGSYQAYKEFMEEIDQPIKIIYGKIGIVRKKAYVVHRSIHSMDHIRHIKSLGKE